MLAVIYENRRSYYNLLNKSVTFYSYYLWLEIWAWGMTMSYDKITIMFLFRRQKFCNGNSCLRFSDCDLLLNKSFLWQKCTLRIAHFSSIYSMILISAFLWKRVCAIKHFKRDTNFSKEPLKLAIEEFILDLAQMRSQRKHHIPLLVLFILDHQDSQKLNKTYIRAYGSL